MATFSPVFQSIGTLPTAGTLASMVDKPLIDLCAVERQRGDEAFLRKIRAQVEQRLPDDIKVEELAKALFYSRVQVFRKIKALTRRSPSHFVRSIRLEKALELLQTTNQPIAEIAYCVGFNDSKYFSRVFVAEFGVAPSVFRKQVAPIGTM